jgi:phosphopantothenoylcysteine decarboxylase / phosphopantothenate---cysteine ligase
MARVLVGVSGGIAAYKACELVRLLVKAGHDVVPLITPGAERFVHAKTFAALARRPVSDDPYPHLEHADLLVVAPCTANTLAKLAHGLADNLVTEAALAHRGPTLVAPAMNVRMWLHPATQANAETLRARGVELIGPEEGELAEGEWGVGRMAEPDDIFRRCQQLLTQSRATTRLRGKRVLVTAGGTREPLDAVRFVGNRSSGRMGVALAAEASRRGASVTLVGSNLTVAAPDGVELVEAPTAEDVARETLARARHADAVLMAAAVADYRPAAPRGDKRSKDDARWQVELEPTTDVLRQLSAHRVDGQILVGFAAEHGKGGLERARSKLEAKGLDLLVYNDVGRVDVGFDAPENEVVLVSPGAQRELPKAPKAEIAAAILDEVAQLLASGGRTAR